MNDLRTEADLRAALDLLGDGAPDPADVVPTRTVPAASRRNRWLAPIAAAAIVVAVAVGVKLHASSPDAPATPAGTGNLVAVVWQVDTIAGTAVPRGFTMQIQPNGNFWQNVGSCSSVTGDLSMTSTQLVVHSSRLTVGLCPITLPYIPAQQLASQQLRSLFTGTLTWSVSKRTLTVRGASGQMVTYTPIPGTPSHLRQWTFHGVGISVPRSWPANARHCGAPTTNTVLFPGATTDCSTSRPPGITTVEFSKPDSAISPLLSLPERSAFQMVDNVEVSEWTGSPASGPYSGLVVIQVHVPKRANLTIASPSRPEAVKLEATIYLTGA